MTPAHLVTLWQAETRKLMSRLSARAGLVVAGLIGVLAPVLVFALTWATYAAFASQFEGQDMPAPEWQGIPRDAGLLWALRARNFLVLPAFLIMVTTLMFAGEYQARTLREDVLRPIPRWAILASKWAAMCTWSAATLVLTWVPAMLLGLVLFHSTSDIGLGGLTLGYVVSGLSDIALGSIVLAIAVLTRSVPGTIVGVFLFYVLSYAALLGMYVSRILPFLPGFAVDIVDALLPWMPSAALSVWRGYLPSVAWAWQGFLGLGLMIGLSAVIALWRFQRMDVP